MYMITCIPLLSLLAEVWNMGLLSKGCPLSWSETKQHINEARRHGVMQFLHIYNREKDRDNDDLKWGDEVTWNWSPQD